MIIYRILWTGSQDADDMRSFQGWEQVANVTVLTFLYPLFHLQLYLGGVGFCMCYGADYSPLEASVYVIIY